MKFNKINLNRTPLSAEEISAAMDFESILNPTAGSITKPKGSGRILRLGLYSVAAAVVIVSSIWFFSSTLESESGIVNENSETVNENNQMVEEPVQVTDSVSIVQSPIEGYRKEFLIATVDCEKGGTVKLGDSEIEVPKNAFTDHNGNLLSGEVELRYREYNDVLDIFLSGIPMEYDSAGVNYTFESNGMFELRGFQNGEEVLVSDSKALDVKMDVADAMYGFSEYYLNESTGKWEFKNAQNYEIETSEIIDDELLASNFDDNDLLENSENESSYTYWITSNSQRNHLENKLRQEIDELDEEIVNTKEPVKPKKADPEIPQIKLEVDYTDFPELKGFDNTLFQVADRDMDEFDEGWGKITWNDISIRKSDFQGEYKMVFYKPGKRIRVNCSPVVAEEDLPEALAIYDNLFDQYQTSLDSLERVQKQKELELKAAAEQARREAEARNAEAVANRNAQVDSQKGSHGTMAKVTAIFTAENFGIHNCDRPVSLPKGKTLLAEFQTDSGDRVSQTVKLIEKNRRAIYHYYPGYKQFKFNPRKENLLISVSDNNRLLVVMPPEFEDLENEKKRCVIKMKECDKELKTRREIEEYLESEGFSI